MPQSYTNAICLPCVGCENKALFPNAQGGVFTQERKAIKDAFLRREYRRDVKFIGQKWDRKSGQKLKHHPLIVPGEISEQQNRLDGTYIFAGYLFPHFGHFLLESLANLWFIKQHPKTPIIWLGVHRQANLAPVAEKLLELYGIENPIHILTEQAEVEELIVPEPGYMIHTVYSEAQAQALELLKCPTNPTSDKKVWLSRSKLGKGLILNEAQLEQILERNGWIIFHPENHPISDQLHMLHDAEHIAGIEGSALHLLMMTPSYKGKVTIFARRPRVEFDFIHIAETLGLNQSVYYPRSTVWSHNQPHWEWNRYWISLSSILDRLNIPKSENNPQAPHGSLTNIVKSLVQHFSMDSAIEFWAAKTTIVSALTSKCVGITVSDRLGFERRLMTDNQNPIDIPPHAYLMLAPKLQPPQLYCFRHHDNEVELFQAFNNTLHKARPSTVWVIEYEAKERSTIKGMITPIETDKASANHALVKYIASCCPQLTVFRVRNANVAVVWQQARKAIKPAISKLSELEDHAEYDRSPIAPLTEIAEKYSNFVKAAQT